MQHLSPAMLFNMKNLCKLKLIYYICMLFHALCINIDIND